MDRYSEVDIYDYKLKKFTCPKNHSFMTLPLLMRGKEWCPECDKYQEIGNIIMNNTNSSRVLPEWIEPEDFEKNKGYSQFGSYKWKCCNGHSWISITDSIIDGEWCKECINDIQSKEEFSFVLDCIANKKDGRCFANDFFGNNTVIWQCKNKHLFVSSVTSVLNGKWCKLCLMYKNNDKDRIKYFKYKRLSRIAKIMLRDVNTEFTKQRLFDIFNLNPSIKAKLAEFLLRYDTKEKLNNYILKSGIRCLSDISSNIREMLNFQCSKNHSWIRGIKQFFKSRKCEQCSSDKKYRNKKFKLELIVFQVTGKDIGISKGNLAVRNYFTQRGINFICERTFDDCVYRRKLHFDFKIEFNNKIVLVEFDGPQHFTYIPHFHRKENDFVHQINKDMTKAIYCKNKQYRLIRVNNIDNVNRDLDKLLNDSNVNVMFIVIDHRLQVRYGGLLKYGPSDYHIN